MASGEDILFESYCWPQQRQGSYQGVFAVLSACRPPSHLAVKLVDIFPGSDKRLPEWVFSC